MDLTALTREELDQLWSDVLSEIERRQVIADAPRQAEELARNFLAADGRTEGAPWVQPTGAHDAYPEGWQVTHVFKTWVSTAPANVWEPGASGWREVVEAGPAPWLQPTGAHDAYDLGDRVTHNGTVWTSTYDANTWEPGVFGWEQEAA